MCARNNSTVKALAVQRIDLLLCVAAKDDASAFEAAGRCG
jgi:hypothetical protein